MATDLEVEQLKQSVSIATLLERNGVGWRVDEAESTRNAVKYRRGPGEIIIVNHEGKGWWDPTSDKSGDVFTLAQHLNPQMDFGEARRLLRSLAGIAPSYPAFDRNAQKEKPEIPVADRWDKRPALSEGSAAWRYLSDQRGLDADTISAASRQGAIKEGPYGSAWFAHRDQSGKIVGIESRGPDYHGFSKGGDKTLFRFRPGAEAPGTEPPSRIAVAEGAIDALSLAQLERAKSGGAFRTDTMYVATGGGIGPHSIEALKSALAALPATAASRMTIATDNDITGDRMSERLHEIAREAGVPATRLKPPGPIKDWNEQVQIGAGIIPYPDAQKTDQPPKPQPGGKQTTEATQPQTEPKMSETNQSNEPPRATRADPPAPARPDANSQAAGSGPTSPEGKADSTVKKDPMVELLEQMKEIAEQMPEADAKKYLREINQFLQSAQNHRVLQTAEFRTKVAWAVFDLEKVSDSQLAMSGSLRRELTERLMPGQEKPTSTEISGRASVAQDNDTPRRTTSQSAPHTPSSGRQGATPQEPETVRVIGSGARSSFMDGVARIVDTLANRKADNAAPSDPNHPPPQTAPRENVANPAETRQTQGERRSWTTEPERQNYAGKAAVEAAFGTAKPTEEARRQMDASPPWPLNQGTGESLADRIARKAREGAEQRLDPEITRTQQAGKNAAAAIEELVAGPARGIQAKISAAAQSEPGGINAVISEMRPDGKYASLRSEFDGALLQNEAFAKSYDKAVGALQQYGNQKLSLEQRFDQFQQDRGILKEKLGGIEEGLAAAAVLPGKEPGKSMIEELGEKLNEFFKKVFDNVKQAFGFNQSTHQRETDNGPRAA